MKTKKLKSKYTNAKNSAKLRSAKIRPILYDIKDGTELVVAVSELFAIIGGLFAL